MTHADACSPPSSLREPLLVAYRSVGIGTFGVVLRFLGMPLEKIALFLNSSQVAPGPNAFGHAVRLTFREGVMAPYRVVGPASVTAWFLQYSVMGLAFQSLDRALGRVLDVPPMWYGDELMKPPPPPSPRDEMDSKSSSSYYSLRSTVKTVLAPLLSGCVESLVANRAEVQRYFGPVKFASIESNLQWNPAGRVLGPAFLANASRNVVMCTTSFVVTPVTYRLYFPQERKGETSLFYYGMTMNFAGNAVAITQQALWGRALDYCAQGGGRNINYGEVIRTSLRGEGMAAFFTLPKWFSRILMNAPVQGSLPWFYNNILPLGEGRMLELAGWVLGGDDLTTAKSLEVTDEREAESGGNQANRSFS